MPISVLPDGTTLVDTASRIVISCNGVTVEESISKIRALQPGQMLVLLQQYANRADLRFGDNLIGAIDYLRHVEKFFQVNLQINIGDLLYKLNKEENVRYAFYRLISEERDALLAQYAGDSLDFCDGLKATIERYYKEESY